MLQYQKYTNKLQTHNYKNKFPKTKIFPFIELSRLSNSHYFVCITCTEHVSKDEARKVTMNTDDTDDRECRRRRYSVFS